MKKCTLCNGIGMGPDGDYCPRCESPKWWASLSLWFDSVFERLGIRAGM